MNIVIRAERHVPRPQGEVFDDATRLENLPKLFPGFGVVPGVLEATIDGTMGAGVLRTVKTKDGGDARERILEHTPSSRHRYTLEGIKAPFSWLVASGTSTIDFAPSGEETDVVWTYEFELTSVLIAPLARLLLAHFRRSMAAGLENLAHLR